MTETAGGRTSDGAVTDGSRLRGGAALFGLGMVGVVVGFGAVLLSYFGLRAFEPPEIPG